MGIYAAFGYMMDAAELILSGGIGVRENEFDFTVTPIVEVAVLSRF